ncbi:hypothetical protein NDU88_003134 [Pleurodeles waltl]|uniref:Uncharacterized protein n=1 Tax=Pleurodeles waltl TaxID=8319 RepID=A0AAV7PHB9_PLEWA|nr:hypothetical protein NDU88_003134 [Pleurodeles waltl]
MEAGGTGSCLNCAWQKPSRASTVLHGAVVLRSRACKLRNLSQSPGVSGIPPPLRQVPRGEEKKKDTGK